MIVIGSNAVRRHRWGAGRSMSRTVKAIVGGAVAFVVAAVAIVMLFAGSLNRVAANEWGCLYGGGLFE
jgi:hypothetical protein